MSRAYDQAYKLLFSEPEMVVDLLRGFVHEPWVKELDFETLEKVSGTYVSDDLRTREDIIDVINNLIEWLTTPEQDRLRRSFTIWITRVLLPTYDNYESPQKINDLIEIKTMLAQRVSEWTREWEQQGWVKGMKKGMEQGLEQGMEKGMEKGMEQGLENEKTLLVRLIEPRFGRSVALSARKMMQPLKDTNTLEQLGDSIIESENGKALLQKLSEKLN